MDYVNLLVKAGLVEIPAPVPAKGQKAPKK